MGVCLLVLLDFFDTKTVRPFRNYLSSEGLAPGLKVKLTYASPEEDHANADVDNQADLGLKVFAGGIPISRAQLTRLMKFT